jgi:hypothetical protein
VLIIPIAPDIHLWQFAQFGLILRPENGTTTALPNLHPCM